MGQSNASKEVKRRYKNRVRYCRKQAGFCIDCPSPVEAIKGWWGAKLPWRCRWCADRFNERERVARAKKAAAKLGP